MSHGAPSVARARRVHPWLALLAVAALAMPGCLEPHRAIVDPDVLTRELRWVRADRVETGSGLGTHAMETNYTFRAGSGPPYSAILQVFSIRELGRRGTDDLLALTHDLVDQGAAAEGIEDVQADREGTRTLANGLKTHWFSQEGTVSASTALFKQDVRVRIIGEVGYDGRSSTSIIAVGIAQVASTQCTILNTCSQREDFRSWNSMVGDPQGSVRGAVSQYGLIHHLVTHD